MICTSDDMENLADFATSPNGVPGLQPKWELTSASSYHVGSATRYFKLEHIESNAQREVLAKALVTAAEQASLAAPGYANVVVSLNYALGHGSDVALMHHSETTVHPQVAEAVGTLKLDWTEGKEGGPFVPKPNHQTDQ